MKLDPFAPRRVSLSFRRQLGTNVGDFDFLERSRPLAAGPYGAVLLSGGDLDCSRYSIAAGEPFLMFSSKGRRVQIDSPLGSVSLDGDPLELFDRLCAACRPDFAPAAEPFSGGAIGYLAYELKNRIEDLPQTARDDLQLPDIFAFWPRNILVHDRFEGTLTGMNLAWEGDPQAGPSVERLLARSLPDSRPSALRTGDLISNFSHPEYLEAIRKIRHYIREGDVYQVNLSQRFQFPFSGDPFQLWTSLYAMNPAPFYAFIQAGDHQILSTSMERFLLRRGTYIETRPIKGTRKRGQSGEEDRALRMELEASPKDDAELSMIVDLLRNDLGRVTAPRSVRVAEHKRLEAYQNVYHLVSIVIGELRPEVTHGDLIRSTFPGGSITGCPKIRSMEIIDELEPHVRHVYTGNIGYFGWHGNLDLSIAIRTGLLCRGVCYFSVGGGIVYDSDEQDEYEETLHKGRTIFQWIETSGGKHS